MSNSVYKFKRNESFCIRDRWIEKAMHAVKEDPARGVFSKNNGVRILGIGSNMVKSLNYWMNAIGLIRNEDRSSIALSERGELLFENDPYLVTSFSWCLIHYWLILNAKDAPLFNIFFNYYNEKYIKKDAFMEYLQQFFEYKNVEVNPSYLANDIAVLFRSYADENKGDKLPEEQEMCPLSNLGLIKNIKKDQYEKAAPSPENLDFRIVYYVLMQALGDKNSFDIDSMVIEENGPCNVFNLSRSLFISYLDVMNKHGYISIIRTAGLNTVNIEKRIDLDSLFKVYLEESNVQ